MANCIPTFPSLGLVTTVSYYNYHLAIAYSEAEPLWVTIGGVPFTGYLYQLSSASRFCVKKTYIDKA